MANDQAQAQFSAGELCLSGPVTFSTVARLQREVDLFGHSQGDVVVNLQQVSRADSAALALLIEWLRQAKQRGRALRFTHLPEDLRALAVVCGVESLLPT